MRARATRPPGRSAGFARAELVLVVALALAARDVRSAAPGPRPARVEVEGPGVVRIELRESGRPDAVRILDVGPTGAAIDLPAGRGVRAHASAAGSVVWPRSAPLRPGAAQTFHVEPLRTVRVVAPAGSTGPLDVAFVPDRSVVPPGPPDRAAALAAWVDTETPEIVPDPAAPSPPAVPVVRLPATAWWAFGTCGADAVTSRCGPADDTVTLRTTALRTLAREPTVRGSPVPEDTLIGPGRLDLAAAAAVRTLLELRAFPGAAVRGRTWAPVRIADAEVVTLSHPRFGVAYASWQGDGLADAVPEPGCLRGRVRGGGAFSGHLALWPAWCGTGGTFSRPSDRHLRFRIGEGTGFVLRGLPPGTYRFDYAVAAAGRRAAPGPTRKGAVRVAAGDRTEVVLEADP